MKNPTVEIVHPFDSNQVMRINASEYDPKTMTLWSDRGKTRHEDGKADHGSIPFEEARPTRTVGAGTILDVTLPREDGRKWGGKRVKGGGRG